MLILYPATLLNLCISSKNRWNLQGFLHKGLCHQQTDIILLLFSPNFHVFFLLVTNCSALANISVIMLNRVMRVDTSCFWSHRKIFQLFAIEYDIYRFVIYGLYYVEVCYIQFVESFNHGIICFLHLLRVLYEFYPSFYNVYACFFTYIESHLFIVYDPFYTILNWICLYSAENFSIHIHCGY